MSHSVVTTQPAPSAPFEEPEHAALQEKLLPEAVVTSQPAMVAEKLMVAQTEVVLEQPLDEEAERRQRNEDYCCYACADDCADDPWCWYMMCRLVCRCLGNCCEGMEECCDSLASCLHSCCEHECCSGETNDTSGTVDGGCCTGGSDGDACCSGGSGDADDCDCGDGDCGDCDCGGCFD